MSGTRGTAPVATITSSKPPATSRVASPYDKNDDGIFDLHLTPSMLRMTMVMFAGADRVGTASGSGARTADIRTDDGGAGQWHVCQRGPSVTRGSKPSGACWRATVAGRSK